MTLERPSRAAASRADAAPPVAPLRAVGPAFVAPAETRPPGGRSASVRPTSRGGAA